MTIWYILYSFGTFYPVLVACSKKNLATLLVTLGTYKSTYAKLCRNHAECQWIRFIALSGNETWLFWHITDEMKSARNLPCHLLAIPCDFNYGMTRKKFWREKSVSVISWLAQNGVISWLAQNGGKVIFLIGKLKLNWLKTGPASIVDSF
jgi:hypothetical protein